MCLYVRERERERERGKEGKREREREREREGESEREGEGDKERKTYFSQGEVSTSIAGREGSVISCQSLHEPNLHRHTLCRGRREEGGGGVGGA